MCRTCDDDNPTPIDMVRAFIDATSAAGCLEAGDTMRLVVPDDFLQHLGCDIASVLGRPLDRIDVDHYLYDMGVIVALPNRNLGRRRLVEIMFLLTVIVKIQSVSEEIGKCDPDGFVWMPLEPEGWQEIKEDISTALAQTVDDIDVQHYLHHMGIVAYLDTNPDESF